MKFEKNDLKTGMIVKLRNNMLFLVMRNVNKGSDGCTSSDVLFKISTDGELMGEYILLDSYNNSLVMEGDHSRDLDICVVYGCHILGYVGFFKQYRVLWSRYSGVRDMTLKEISDELGYKVRIVG